MPTTTPVIRTCVGCRVREDRTTLVRVVLVARDEGHATAAVDEGMRLPGRGAWLHPNGQCLDLAERRRAFGRALRTPGVALDITQVKAWVQQQDATKQDTRVGQI